MEENKLFYIAYDEDGNYEGVTDTLITFEVRIKEYGENLLVTPITSEIRNALFGKHKRYTINVNKIEEAKVSMEDPSVFVIDSLDYFNFISCQTDMVQVRKNLIKSIKEKCGNYITSGMDIALSSGDIKHFSFKMEDQINLSELVNTKQEGDVIFYHADGEYNTTYSYEDIYLVYKTLYNNKVYNQIYTQVLCEWVLANYTLEMHKAKDPVVDYGYTNDEITLEVNSVYEQQKLSE